MTLLSIIIPVYNSRDTLAQLQKKIEQKVKINHEIIFVNDDSRDNSWQVIQGIAANKKNILGINLLKNVGQDNAIIAGLSFAKGDYIIIMDDDLQHDPSYIKDLYDKCKEGYDVVYANFLQKKQKLWKNFGSWLNGKFASFFFKKPHQIYISPFKIIKKEIVEEIYKFKSPYVYIDGIIFSLTSNITQVNIEHHERKIGKSNYSISNSLFIFFNHLTGYSLLPLRLVTISGFIVAIIGLILSIILVVEYFSHHSIPEGWTSLMVVLLFVGGIIMFSLGIIGEYIGRLYLLMSNKPQYLIKEKTKK